MFGMSKYLGGQNPKNWIFETTLFFVLFLSLQDGTCIPMVVLGSKLLCKWVELQV
jgi:hypothetical protein